MDRLEGWLDQLDRNMNSGDLRIADTAKWDRSNWPSKRADSGRTRSRAGRSGTGWRSPTERSRATRRSCRRPGTPAHATPRASPGPTSRRWSGRRSPTPHGRSSCCGPCTPSTRAWPARSTCSTPSAAGRGRSSASTRRLMASVAPPSRGELDAAARPARHAIYVFERPVRIVHWTIVFALLVLSLTGYYLHHPFLSGSGMPGHPGFAMGDDALRPRDEPASCSSRGPVPDLLGLRRQPLC